METTYHKIWFVSYSDKLIVPPQPPIYNIWKWSPFWIVNDSESHLGK